MTPQLSMGLLSFAVEEPSSWEPLFARARAADAAGIDRVVVSDHVVFGETLEEYGRPELGGDAGGRQPTGPDGHWLEPLTTLSVLAGMTRRVRLGTNILLAALRRPAVLAKTTATLDVLSGGRLDLGVGVGWQRQEYEATGLDFAHRGRLLDHTLEVCQVLWREQRATYEAPELAFDGIHAMPKPSQPGGVPIWVSGTVNARVARRLARFGSGWIPWGPAAADLPRGISDMRRALEDIGHDPTGLPIVGYLPVVRGADKTVALAATMDGVAGLVAAGVTDLRVNLRLPESEAGAVDTLSTFVDAFRVAAGRPAHQRG